MALIAFPDAGFPQTLNLSKLQHPHGTVNHSLPVPTRGVRRRQERGRWAWRGWGRRGRDVGPSRHVEVIHGGAGALDQVDRWEEGRFGTG